MRAAAVVGMVLLCGIAQGAEPKTVTNTIGMELIDIPAGQFTMGQGGGTVIVTLTKPFGLGKTEVTQGQWQQVMGTEPWKGQPQIQADKDCPATYVSWNDATAFCQKLTDLERKAGELQADESYRLPTEAEWEYACRAGTQTAFSFGDDEKQLGEYAWFRGNALDAGEIYAHKVGMKKPSPWGLHDMHGNVWEWCSDWYDKKLSYGTDPVGPGGGSHRVFRSGSWGFEPEYCRSAGRGGNDPSDRNYSLGFRVARSQSDPSPVANNTIGMVLIEIPAGEFTMGSPAGEKGHQANEEQVAVTLTKPFLLGKYEVTQGQWRQVMGTVPWFDGGKDNWVSGEDNAASYVHWNAARNFCQKLTDLERKAGKLPVGESYRLPTEAEWEYACRAGTTTAYSFGDDKEQLGEYGWFSGNTRKAALEEYAHKVGLKKPNPWGLYDMHGNVMEWCSDRYDEELSGGTDPVGPEGDKVDMWVRRGGFWGGYPEYCRSANRSGGDGYAPSFRNYYQGFRVARSQ